MADPLEIPTGEYSGGTIGGIAKEKYDQALGGTGSKIWNGVLQVAPSGFGKGVIIAAAASVAIIAALGAFLASAHGLPIEQGIASGINMAVNFLTHLPGLGMLAAGGAIGAGVDMAARKNELSAEEARDLAAKYEARRAQPPQPAIRKQPEAPAKTSLLPAGVTPVEGDFCNCIKKPPATAQGRAG